MSAGRPQQLAAPVDPPRSAGAGHDPERSGGSASPVLIAPPDPEVRPVQRRRSFSAEEKRRILAEVDALKESGQIGAYLRRKGLYSSNITDWRREFEQGGLTALEPRRRGPQPQPQQDEELARRVAELEREKAQLEQRLRQAELIVDIQKKLSQMLGLPPVSGQSE